MHHIDIKLLIGVSLPEDLLELVEVHILIHILVNLVEPLVEFLTVRVGCTFLETFEEVVIDFAFVKDIFFLVELEFPQFVIIVDIK